MVGDDMQAPISKIVLIALAAAMALVTIDAAAAKRRVQRTGDAELAFWGGLVPTENGTPVIMKGYHPPAPPREEATQQRADRPVHIPRGSSSYVDIPPPMPSPYSRNSPPAAALTQPTVQPYNPPHITTFSDKVTDAIHAYPLEKGLGNNPIDQQSFIRQRVNQ
jgi:hypothetical protein